MPNDQGAEELLADAGYAKKTIIKTEPSDWPHRSRADKIGSNLNDQPDYVPLDADHKRDTRGHDRRGGYRVDGGRGTTNSRYLQDGGERGSKELSEDEGHTSDRGSANGSVRTRRRSRSPQRAGRYRDDNRQYRSRSGDRDGRGGVRGSDDFYRPSPRDRVDRRDEKRDVVTRDDRRDNDKRDRRNDRRDDRRDPRDRRRKSNSPRDEEVTDNDKRTVFVQQLAARLRTYQLKEFFQQCGAVKEAQIVKDLSLIHI